MENGKKNPVIIQHDGDRYVLINWFQISVNVMVIVFMQHFLLFIIIF